MKNIFKILILLLATLLFSCQENKNPCSLSEEVLQDISFVDSMINLPEIIKRDKDWKKNNYNEPSLFHAKKESYRFIWSSSFDGTKVFRIEKDKNTYKAILKEYENHSDTIGKTNEFELKKENWTSIINHLNKYDFWTYKSSIDRRGLDGAGWGLEAYKPTKDNCTHMNYHMIGRWSPIDTVFISMCNQFFSLEKKIVNNLDTITNKDSLDKYVGKLITIKGEI